jgi:hypothetical protein
VTTATGRGVLLSINVSSLSMLVDIIAVRRAHGGSVNGVAHGTAEDREELSSGRPVPTRLPT